VFTEETRWLRSYYVRNTG